MAKARQIIGNDLEFDVLDTFDFDNSTARRLDTIHRNRAVGEVVERLREQGVDAHLSGRCFRGLLQIFGAFSPIEVLVPADQFERARDAVVDGGQR